MQLRTRQETARRALRVAAALVGLAGLWGSGSARADVLPEDRADVLYHRYDGGGLVVEGPSVLVQKKVTEKFAVTSGVEPVRSRTETPSCVTA